MLTQVVDCALAGYASNGSGAGRRIAMMWTDSARAQFGGAQLTFPSVLSRWWLKRCRSLGSAKILQRVGLPVFGDHMQELVIALLTERGVGGSFNRFVLPNSAARLRDDHADQSDRNGILFT